jgi:hypothetical protein
MHTTGALIWFARGELSQLFTGLSLVWGDAVRMVINRGR